MHIIRRTLLGASTVGLAALLSAATVSSFAVPAGAASVQPQIPQFAVAQSAAAWIAGQQAANGSIGGSLSTTVNAILALAAAHVDTSGAQAALSYVEANADSYITVDNADGPGQLANLILDAYAMGVDPTNFGGTNLVTRLRATEQTSGPDAGLFGNEKQLSDFLVGTYDQGLVFTALKAVGQTANAAAIGWLTAQQCPNGGWVLPEPGHRRRVCRGSLELHGTRQSDDLPRRPGAHCTGRADARDRSQCPLLLHLRSGCRRWLELLPQLGGAAPRDRLAIHRLGDPVHSRHGPLADEVHLHHFGSLAGQRPPLLRGDLGE